MSVDQSGGLRMEIGVLYLSHAMLVLAELIVCSKCVYGKVCECVSGIMCLQRIEIF